MYSKSNNKLEVAVFGGGCFWCTEAIFAELKGVEKVVPGYAGGKPPVSGEVPSYEQVSTGTTGHAEVIKISFDPNVIRYQDLLEVFFAVHDPTTANQQGQDIGPQYRSLILYTTEAQKTVAEKFVKPGFVTEIKPLEKFFEGEEYHRQYYASNPTKPYCQLVINPKLAKFRERFGRLRK